MARRKASSLTLITLTRGLQLLRSVINGRHGSTAAFRDNRDLECMVDTNSDGITMIEFGAYDLQPIYESHVFATPITKQQFVTYLNDKTMLAGYSRIINDNVILGSTANKSDISILESVLSHCEVLVF